MQQDQKQTDAVTPKIVKLYRINSGPPPVQAPASAPQVRFKDEDTDSLLSIAESLFTSRSVNSESGPSKPVKFYCMRRGNSGNRQQPGLVKSVSASSLNTYYQPKQQVEQLPSKPEIKYVKPILKPTIVTKANKDEYVLKVPEGLQEDDDEETEEESDYSDNDDDVKIKVPTATVKHFNNKTTTELELESDEDSEDEQRRTKLSIVKEDDEDLYYDTQSLKREEKPEVKTFGVKGKEIAKKGAVVKTAKVKQKEPAKNISKKQESSDEESEDKSEDEDDLIKHVKNKPANELIKKEVPKDLKIVPDKAKDVAKKTVVVKKVNEKIKENSPDPKPQLNKNVKQVTVEDEEKVSEVTRQKNEAKKEAESISKVDKNKPVVIRQVNAKLKESVDDTKQEANTDDEESIDDEDEEVSGQSNLKNKSKNDTISQTKSVYNKNLPDNKQEAKTPIVANVKILETTEEEDSEESVDEEDQNNQELNKIGLQAREGIKKHENVILEPKKAVVVKKVNAKIKETVQPKSEPVVKTAAQAAPINVPLGNKDSDLKEDTEESNDEDEEGEINQGIEKVNALSISKGESVKKPENMKLEPKKVVVVKKVNAKIKETESVNKSTTQTVPVITAVKKDTTLGNKDENLKEDTEESNDENEEDKTNQGIKKANSPASKILSITKEEVKRKPEDVKLETKKAVVVKKVNAKIKETIVAKPETTKDKDDSSDDDNIESNDEDSKDGKNKAPSKTEEKVTRKSDNGKLDSKTDIVKNINTKITEDSKPKAKSPENSAEDDESSGNDETEPNSKFKEKNLVKRNTSVDKNQNKVFNNLKESPNEEHKLDKKVPKATLVKKVNAKIKETVDKTKPNPKLKAVVNNDNSEGDNEESNEELNFKKKESAVKNDTIAKNLNNNSREAIEDAKTKTKLPDTDTESDESEEEEVENHTTKKQVVKIDKSDNTSKAIGPKLKETEKTKDPSKSKRISNVDKTAKNKIETVNKATLVKKVGSQNKKLEEEDDEEDESEDEDENVQLNEPKDDKKVQKQAENQKLNQEQRTNYEKASISQTVNDKIEYSSESEEESYVLSVDSGEEDEGKVLGKLSPQKKRPNAATANHKNSSPRIDENKTVKTLEVVKEGKKSSEVKTETKLNHQKPSDSEDENVYDKEDKKVPVKSNSPVKQITEKAVATKIIEEHKKENSNIKLDVKNTNKPVAEQPKAKDDDKSDENSDEGDEITVRKKQNSKLAKKVSQLNESDDEQEKSKLNEESIEKNSLKQDKINNKEEITDRNSSKSHDLKPISESKIDSGIEQQTTDAEENLKLVKKVKKIKKKKSIKETGHEEESNNEISSKKVKKTKKKDAVHENVSQNNQDEMRIPLDKQKEEGNFNLNNSFNFSKQILPKIESDVNKNEYTEDDSQPTKSKKIIRRRIVYRKKNPDLSNDELILTDNAPEVKKPIKNNFALTPENLISNEIKVYTVEMIENESKKQKSKSLKPLKNRDDLDSSFELTSKQNTNGNVVEQLKIKKIKKKKLKNLNDSLEDLGVDQNNNAFSETNKSNLKRNKPISSSIVEPKIEGDISKSKTKKIKIKAKQESGNETEQDAGGNRNEKVKILKKKPATIPDTLQKTLNKLEHDLDEQNFEEKQDLTRNAGQLDQTSESQFPKIKQKYYAMSFGENSRQQSPKKILKKTQSFLTMNDMHPPKSSGTTDSGIDPGLSKSMEIFDDSSRETFSRMTKPKIFKRDSAKSSRHNKSGDELFLDLEEKSFQREKSYLIGDDYSDDDFNRYKSGAKTRDAKSSKDKLFQKRIHTFTPRTEGSSDSIVKLPNIKRHTNFESSPVKNYSPTERDRFFSKSNLSSLKSNASTKSSIPSNKSMKIRAGSLYNDQFSKSMGTFDNNKNSSSFKSESVKNFNSSQKNHFTSQKIEASNDLSMDSLNSSGIYKRCPCLMQDRVHHTCKSTDNNDKLDADRFYLYDYWFENKEVLYATNYIVKECKVCSGFYAYNPYDSNDDKKKKLKRRTPWNSVF